MLSVLVAGCVAYVPSHQWGRHHGHRHGYDDDRDWSDRRWDHDRKWDDDRWEDGRRGNRRYR